MTTVNKTAESLEEGITNLMNGAKEDYFRWSSQGKEQISSYTQEQLNKRRKKIH